MCGVSMPHKKEEWRKRKVV